MKARIKKTGEIVNIVSYAKIKLLKMMFDCKGVFGIFTIKEGEINV